MGSQNPQHNALDIDLISLDEVDSTNDELRRILASEPYSPLRVTAVLAKRQTKGKGRLGRAWSSPPGGLYLSLSLETTGASYRESTLSLVVALGVRAALAELSEVDIAVKWPNDLLCTKGKLAGILIESFATPAAKRFSITGIGVNLTRHTLETHEHNAVAYLSDLTTSHLTREVVAQGVLQSVCRYYLRWRDAAYDFTQFVEEYNRHLSLSEQQVAVSTGDNDLIAEGRVEGIDAQGQLILKDENDRLVRIGVGEVSLRR